MSNTFADRYAGLLTSDVFSKQARQELAAGVDGMARALAYAGDGRPDFTLAYLLLIEGEDEQKQEILASSYSRRAQLSEEKAELYNLQFHRPFPLIKMEAQKDRVMANRILQGLPL